MISIEKVIVRKSEMGALSVLFRSDSEYPKWKRI